MAVTLATQTFGQHASPNAEAAALFSANHLTGAMVVQDIPTGAVIVSLSSGFPTPVLPLSAAKLFVAAAYLENRAKLPAAFAADPHALIAYGMDLPGKQMALGLRHALGSAAVIDELARFGVPPCSNTRQTDCQSLSPKDSDAQWANALSLGETEFRVTPMALARFLRIVGSGGAIAGSPRVMRDDTAHALRAAMIDTVRIGTASGIRGRLGALGQIGGKTGTGPANTHPYDGIFAGLVFDRRGDARYAIVTYVRHGGRGGGIAADISEKTAETLLGGK
jgi:hypothetical protein